MKERTYDPVKYAEYYAANREAISRRKAEQYQKRADLLRERSNAYNAAHREEKREYQTKYNATHKKKYRAWENAHTDKTRAKIERRRALRCSLPGTFTDADWYHALDYFHGVCAYCGKTPKKTLHADHYIPLSNPACPGSIPRNMIPACQSCNSSKSDSAAHEWLIRKFGVAAEQIEKRIAEFFATFPV